MLLFEFLRQGLIQPRLVPKRYEVKDHLELLILLLPPPKFWDGRYVSPCQAEEMNYFVLAYSIIPNIKSLVAVTMDYKTNNCGSMNYSLASDKKICTFSAHFGMAIRLLIFLLMYLS